MEARIYNYIVKMISLHQEFSARGFSTKKQKP